MHQRVAKGVQSNTSNHNVRLLWWFLKLTCNRSSFLRYFKALPISFVSGFPLWFAQPIWKQNSRCTYHHQQTAFSSDSFQINENIDKNGVEQKTKKGFIQYGKRTSNALTIIYVWMRHKMAAVWYLNNDLKSK
jgi:hypothetical protein